MPDYLPALIMIGLALLFGILVIGVTFVFGPKKPTPEKLAPYESGISDIDAPHQRFPVKYLVTGMLFIIFDVEVASALPLAVLMRRLGVMGLVEFVVFTIILAVPFIYIWRKGAFTWE
jgi:NADH-quinone oxidoreductase subunit A